MLGKVAQKLVPGYFSTAISLRSLTEKGEAAIFTVQTAGEALNYHPHLHGLLTLRTLYTRLLSGTRSSSSVSQYRCKCLSRRFSTQHGAPLCRRIPPPFYGNERPSSLAIF
jgi:hypothetical protein